MIRIVAIGPNGRETIAEGYTSRGHAFASATKQAIDIRVAGNPGRWERLELERDDGTLVTEYNGHDWLRIKQPEGLNPCDPDGLWPLEIPNEN